MSAQKGIDLEKYGDKPWLSGEPFYCVKCGAGFYEFMACEMPDCELEGREEAQKRRDHAIQSELSKGAKTDV